MKLEAEEKSTHEKAIAELEAKLESEKKASKLEAAETASSSHAKTIAELEKKLAAENAAAAERVEAGSMSTLRPREASTSPTRRPSLISRKSLRVGEEGFKARAAEAASTSREAIAELEKAVAAETKASTLAEQRRRRSDRADEDRAGGFPESKLAAAERRRPRRRRRQPRVLDASVPRRVGGGGGGFRGGSRRRRRAKRRPKTNRGRRPRRRRDIRPRLRIPTAWITSATSCRSTS